uniref:FoP_duplication domain-containing protein n=1 Tax=Caenorhabditis tropicalis TaxID=1561998 RepID=A0A1I7UX48_9PELO
MAIQVDAALSQSISKNAPKKRSEKIKNQLLKVESKLTGRVTYSVSKSSKANLNPRRSAGIQKERKGSGSVRNLDSDRSSSGRPAEDRKSFQARSPLEPRKSCGGQKPFDRSSKARKPIKGRKPFGNAKKENKKTVEELDAELDAYMNREN